jgi:hypothetical protein
VLRVPLTKRNQSAQTGTTMANTKAPHARLVVVLVLAAMGVACSPTTLPLPMLSAGHGTAHATSHTAAATGAR